MKDRTKTKKMTNSVRMLELLKKHKRLKAREIAEMLGLTSTRVVYYYKNTLEMFGYNIQTTGGYTGGYELVRKFSDDELKLIEKKLPKEIFEKIKDVY